MMVNTKMVHQHLVLDEVVMVYYVWLRNQKINGGKVGKKIKCDQMTIISCELIFDSKLI